MIYGELVRLRAITTVDLPMLIEWRKHPEIKAMLGGWSFPVSLGTEQEWFAKASQDQSTRRLTIEVLADSRYVGNAGLYNMDGKSRKAEYGILIGDKAAWGRGYCLDASSALLTYAFREPNLQRVLLRFLAQQRRALRLYGRIGFQTEGRMREDTFRGGEYQDSLLMGILASEFGG